MENNLLICLLILLIGLYISFVIFIADYSLFKKRIEKILDLNIEVNDNAKEVINITKKVNDSVGQICEINNKLIRNINLLLHDNTYLKVKLENKEETNEE